MGLPTLACMDSDRNNNTVEAGDFIARWAKSGGAELANYQLFAVELCELLDLPRPDPATEKNEQNDYVFERSVAFKHADGTQTNGRIDLYKRNSFILEAKQSAKRQKQANKEDKQLGLLSEDALRSKSGTAKRGTRTWDSVMQSARKQAEDYARALPVDHGYPPFLLIVDVGHVIEVFADFSGQGKNYAHFPDRQSYRITLDDLAVPDVQDRLRAIWTDPQALDPARKSAEVTRDIAARLATIAKRLEGKHDPKTVAEFLMRCLFTMFAEDVGLLPTDSFVKLLEQMKETPRNFPVAMEHLWSTMDTGGYAPQLNETVKRFNGTLFKSRTALPLDAEDIQELWAAAKRDWHEVEPAIFGTLLERALDTRERSKLGAHYTPRAYVERLVVPTIIEPLRNDWEEVQAHIEDLRTQGKEQNALNAARAFHRKLCTTRVLDPACGTGNFLYVSLELMKKLEGEVLEAIADLGGRPDRLSDFAKELSGQYPRERLQRSEGLFTVDPHQFYGLEINPRAVAIADLVLWIGYLKWQLRTGGPDAVTEPVLDAYGTIREQDAILAYDKRDLARDEIGKPITIWDGITKKDHPVTGAKVPDESARKETYTYTNPKPAVWPEAEFVVGNPPFIGGKDMRAELGDGYAEAAWKARPHMPGGADFVMHFWDQAATILLTKKSVLRRFGFITTNSITQTFSRRVIERHMNAKAPLSLVYAVPDHPWLKASDKAAVRIAMTVAVKGSRPGALAHVVSEKGINTDTPIVGLVLAVGRINSNLSIGPDVSNAVSLLSNLSITSPGVKLHGSGFLVQSDVPRKYGLGRLPGLERHIRKFKNGRDISSRSRNVYVIDLYGLNVEEVRERYPDVYQHVLDNVKPERDQNNRSSYRENWWLFGEPRSELREAVAGLDRWIVSVHTAKHRFFCFLDSSDLPENGLVNFCRDDGEFLSLLSSRVHVLWSMKTCAWMGVGNDSRYILSRCFEPFPFPDLHEKTQLGDLGERLDVFRKDRLIDNDVLSMTGFYNVLERLRETENGCDVPPLSEKEKEIHEAGLISVLKEIHDDIDRAVFEAYGWDDLIPALVGRPGATTPSPHKTSEQEEAEEELLSRLVRLNQERTAEEAQGMVRWLRPEFQIPKLGHKVNKPAAEKQLEADIALTDGEKKPAWPKDGLDQIRAVRDVLATAQTPVTIDALASSFAGRRTEKRRERLDQVLETLVVTGVARAAENSDETAFFLPG